MEERLAVRLQRGCLTGQGVIFPYVYGDIIAKVLHAKLEKLTEASAKRSLLESFAGALSQNDSLEKILGSLGTSWDEAVTLYAEE